MRHTLLLTGLHLCIALCTLTVQYTRSCDFVEKRLPMIITFEKANSSHIDIIFSWLKEPHMIEFWDNSQEHKNDILNFTNGRPQHDYAGTTHYWIGKVNDVPYCFILSDIIEPCENMPELYKHHFSRDGRTITIDFGIGNPDYLGKGLAAPTLEKFVTFYREHIDNCANTFFIDPDINNARARHVYSKAGFQEVGTYLVSRGTFKGHTICLMIRKHESV